MKTRVLSSDMLAGVSAYTYGSESRCSRMCRFLLPQALVDETASVQLIATQGGAPETFAILKKHYNSTVIFCFVWSLL